MPRKNREKEQAKREAHQRKREMDMCFIVTFYRKGADIDYPDAKDAFPAVILGGVDPRLDPNELGKAVLLFERARNVEDWHQIASCFRIGRAWLP